MLFARGGYFPVLLAKPKLLSNACSHARATLWRRGRVVVTVALVCWMPSTFSADEGTGNVTESDCAELLQRYRTLERNAPGSPERARVAALVMPACAAVEIRLLRATTLEGAPVLESPASIVRRTRNAP